MKRLITRVWTRFRPTPRGALALAAVLTLIGLAFMVWSMLKPSALPVIMAMSLGQLFGTLAFALYGYVVLLDVLRIRRARRSSMQLPVIKEPK